MKLLPKVNFVPWLQSKGKEEQAVHFGWQSRTSFLLYLGISVSVLLPLLAYAYLGIFARYRADDYCAAGMLQDSGILQASLIRYREWSGGYSNLLFIQVGEWFGEAGMVYMAAATLICGSSPLDEEVTKSIGTGCVFSESTVFKSRIRFVIASSKAGLSGP